MKAKLVKKDIKDIFRILGLLTEQDRQKFLSRYKTYEQEQEECVVTEIESDNMTTPTESEVRQAKLTNTPTRGFCISADLEQIAAESYKYLYDPEEFEPPEL